MPAPEGNQNAKRAKIWRNAIERAIARKADGKLDMDAGLDRLADKLVSAGISGEQWALLEIGNRLDGKPLQSLDANVDAGDRLLAVLVGLGKGNNPPVA